MWPSVLDVQTGRYPESDHVPQRVYRLIGAPRGSTLYWDQPMVVAAYRLSKTTGDTEYAEAADDYVEAFLSHCVAEDGMFRWGNHQYYDVFEQKVVEFSGGCHELRPITPAWDVFWRHAPQKTAEYIRVMSNRHLYDSAKGGFNRHDDGKKGHAFLETGGILSESLAWLFARTRDESLLKRALRIAGYSYDHRHPVTGLVPNEPDTERWDSHVCTSEIGLWAQCLLRARNDTGSDVFLEMARQSVRAYLDYAFDRESGRYFGQVKVHDGDPAIPEHSGYWPRKYSDPWNTDQWPNHDYPMPLAEACLSLCTITGEDAFLDDARRWAQVVSDTRPAQAESWAYAESYGRCIHFLTRAGLELNEEEFLSDAHMIADEAIDRLFENGMFKGCPAAHIYESVDGVGYLILALLFLDMRQPIKKYHSALTMTVD